MTGERSKQMAMFGKSQNVWLQPHHVIVQFDSRYSILFATRQFIFWDLSPSKAPPKLNLPRLLERTFSSERSETAHTNCDSTPKWFRSAKSRATPATTVLSPIHISKASVFDKMAQLRGKLRDLWVKLQLERYRCDSSFY
jgi:hypothetical protein